jgi:hypothetical protein
MNQLAIAQTIANLDAWLETMRQPGGYGGPVAHWWQNRFQYTGPGLDWRYEGILIGYTTLYEKTKDATWCQRLNTAAEDLMNGQLPDGSYRASRFEINPGTLGTPHEAAATLGLLTALPHLQDKARALNTAKCNLDNLIDKLWDGKGFNDRPKGKERVPNKLATLAQTLITYAEASGDEQYLLYAKACLDDVLRYQEQTGRYKGAVHQYAPGIRQGDGRFFPYYNARCIPPLVLGKKVFNDTQYLQSARDILNFIKNSMHSDGSWSQIIYSNGRSAEWPRWIAGTADILLAFGLLDEALPEVSFGRLINSQAESGSFPTAHGFTSQINQHLPPKALDYRDAIPVVGWNDKCLRFLTSLLYNINSLPISHTTQVFRQVHTQVTPTNYLETQTKITLNSQQHVHYIFFKTMPWASVSDQKMLDR